MRITLTKGIGGKDVPVIFLQTECAVAADYLSFLNGVIDVLREERRDLEREANASGRTLKQPLKGVGSKRIEVQDE